ncbi:ef-hand calcium-binding hypothetical protein [Limosa lapponica baueri]|uniref:CCDC81 HU domain-containing protein n=1 Tax=Limosa lapponica baueri TaxID=1758121 RepID=A0A2I0T9C1_LIMLA|nr:ef-hand calcium-binding hypothetical protein [Limosa lapponica baueri]
MRGERKRADRGVQITSTYTLKGSREFLEICQQKSGEGTLSWILQAWDSGAASIHLSVSETDFLSPGAIDDQVEQGYAHLQNVRGPDSLQMLVLLFFFQPQAVSVTGLGTFYIKKCHFFEDGKMVMFQKPVFSLSRTVAQISELQHASVPVPGEIKKVSVSYKKTHLEVPYSEKVAQHCVQETLDFLYFILKKKEDTDFVLKDVGTLAIRGTEVTMAFCEDLLLSLNESRDTVEKLLTNKDSSIECKEKCPMPSSGDRPVDEHCLPSTIEADFGELVDRYRSRTVAVYMQSSKLCKEREVCITKPTLQKGLLHPGDKIIKEGGDIRKIRQPGGYYSTGRADAPSPGSTYRSGSQAVDAEKSPHSLRGRTKVLE